MGPFISVWRLFRVLNTLAAKVQRIWVERGCGLRISLRVQKCNLQMEWWRWSLCPIALHERRMPEIRHWLLSMNEQVAMAITKLPADNSISQRIRGHFVLRSPGQANLETDVIALAVINPFFTCKDDGPVSLLPHGKRWAALTVFINHS